MIPLLLIDELHSCKWQDKLIDQLVVGRCSISPKYPKLEVGEGIHFFFNQDSAFLHTNRTSTTNLMNTSRLWRRKKKEAFSFNCIFWLAKHFLSSSPQHTQSRCTFGLLSHILWKMHDEEQQRAAAICRQFLSLGEGAVRWHRSRHFRDYYCKSKYIWKNRTINQNYQNLIW